MLGAILGDIVGSTYEFANTKNYHFEMFPQGSDFTDDTVLTVAVADAILNKKDYGKTIRQWALRYPNPKGAYGGSFLRWMFSPDTKPYGSFGNGSAMRVSAVGWLFDTEEEVLDEARKSAECTHNHPEGIKGAQATAIAVYFAREKKDKRFIKEYISRKFGYDLNKTVESIRETYSFNETCQETVPQAIVAFLDSTSFEDAIRKAIFIGGDSDTIGAITGGIAEAFYGIPPEFAQKALSYLPKDIYAVVEHFNARQGNSIPDIHPETRDVRFLYARLKKEFSELFAQRQEMLLHDEPLLTALYLQKVGHKQYEVYCLNVELATLKQRLALLQAFVNRNEKPDLQWVEKEIKTQFAEYRQKIEAQAQQLAAAHNFLKGSFLSPEETQKIKEIYRVIVKRLHPDIHPHLPENMKDLFVQAQTAYELNDWRALQQILLMLDNEKTDEDSNPSFSLQNSVNRLQENIQALKQQIEQLNQQFPFIYGEKLNDGAWVKAECEAAETEINSLKQEIEKYRNYIILLEEWKQE